MEEYLGVLGALSIALVVPGVQYLKGIINKDLPWLYWLITLVLHIGLGFATNWIGNYGFDVRTVIQSALGLMSISMGAHSVFKGTKVMNTLKGQ